ncbi:hypothetical protein KCU71_g22913, partial [Aureobasidium melanogenum]
PAQGYSQEEYDQSQSGTPVPAPSQAPARKKRAYAGQAFEFGAGANAGAPATQTPPPAAAYGAAQPAAGYGYGAPVQQPAGYPDPQQQAAAAYGAPAAGYQPPDAYGAAPGGVPGMTQQFAQMGMAPQQQQPAQAPQQPAPVAQRLNPLQPVDISVQGAPFHVSDLDLPPPPIILPPNSSVTPSPNANCPPKYVRSTLNAIPSTNSLLKKSKLPFALVIQPYATLHDAEDDVPVQPDQVIARCRRCRTYINPFATFLDHSHRWRCNMCNLTNDVPQAFDWDNMKQQAIDRWQRPELNYSVMEFVAPQEYMVRAPQPLVYLFLFDVSVASVQSGL